MASNQGRLGSIGIAFQSAFGSPDTTMDVFIPYNSNTMEGMHEPIAVNHAVGHRMSEVSSVMGKKRGEGSLEANLDVTHAGYFFKWALGNELYTAGTPSNHVFYTIASGNAPLFATVINTRPGADVEQFSDAAVNTLTLNVADGLATVAVNVMSKFPTTGATQTPTTVSGTVFSFANMGLQFGSSLAVAGSATPTPVQEFSLEINNNLEVIHSTQATSGTATNDVSMIRCKNLEISGQYKLFFDSTTDRDAYYTLNKRSMIAKFSNGSLEDLTVKIAKFRLDEKTVETGIDDLYMITGTYKAELDRSQVPNDLNVTINNAKASTY